MDNDTVETLWDAQQYAAYARTRRETQERLAEIDELNRRIAHINTRLATPPYNPVVDAYIAQITEALAKEKVKCMSEPNWIQRGD